MVFFFFFDNVVDVMVILPVVCIRERIFYTYKIKYTFLLN